MAQTLKPQIWNKTMLHSALYSEASLSPYRITSLISVYKHFTSNLPAISSNITNAELVWPAAEEREPTRCLWAFSRSRRKEGKAFLMFCHDANQKGDVFSPGLTTVNLTGQSCLHTATLKEVILLISEYFPLQNLKLSALFIMIVEGRSKVLPWHA